MVQTVRVGLTRGRRWLVGIGAALTLGAGLGPVAWQITHPAPPVQALAGYDDPRLTRRDGEDELTYITRANRTVSEAVEHRNNSRAPQTWQVAFMDTISGGKFTGAWSLNEGIIAPRWLRRGYCSQHAAALAAVLRSNGIQSADAYQIDGHVVVQFEHERRTWIVDPDLGVAPFIVDWSDPGQLSQAAHAAYADTPAPYDAAWATPIYTDTSGDAGTYPRPYLTAIATMQDQALAEVSVGRWILFGLGAALMAAGSVGVIRSRRTE